MYTAAVLSADSASLLKSIVRNALNLEDRGFRFLTHLDDELPHHMTLNLGNFDTELNDVNQLNQKVELFVNRIVYDEELGVCAAPVDCHLKSINNVPHITICLKKDVKPYLSNKMLESSNSQEVNLDQTYSLEAIIQEVS